MDVLLYSIETINEIYFDAEYETPTAINLPHKQIGIKLVKQPTMSIYTTIYH